MFGRYAFMRLEVFSEKGKIRKLQFKGYFLNRGLGMAEHIFYFSDSSFINPFRRSPSTGFFHHGSQIFGRDA